MRALAFAALAAFAASSLALAAAAKDPDRAVRAIPINEHVTAFYQGRPEESTVPPGPHLWPENFAIFVGVATYAVHDGGAALVYDTFTDTASAQWVRDWLRSKAGARRFILVNSHWHLDHIGGNAVYDDSLRFATEATRVALEARRAAIEAGTEDGPPAIKPLVLPNVGIAPENATITIMVGKVRVLLRPDPIHSADGLVIQLPGDGLLLAGDTLEDTLTFVAEPESIPAQYRALGAMRDWNFTKILPNHGNPAVIAAGGYGRGLIDATRSYVRALVERSHDANFRQQPLESFIGPALERGDVSLWWAYRDAHAHNVEAVEKAWRDRPIPAFDDGP